MFQNEVGLIAVNDSLYLDTVIYAVLKKYIKPLPYYVDILELFHEVSVDVCRMFHYSSYIETKPFFEKLRYFNPLRFYHGHEFR